MSGDLTGAAALVTGGASGLGRATAASLVDAGATVVLADLPGSPGAATAEELGPRAVFCPTDVTAEEDVQRAVDTAAAAGPLRVVVNCAGVATPGRILGRRGPLPLDAFRAVVEVNLVGTFNVLRLAAAAMRDNEPVDGERGVAVLTASVAAFEGQVGQAAYAASKGGVAALTISAARDLADAGIRVVTVAPGIFETPMLRGLPEPVQRSLAEQVPHPSRLGHPEEYAKLVRHIVANRYLNGGVIRLDGAVRMAPR
ncbi:SDR family NAD(P)-dependent oxidoreductase [Phytohabitans sp. ZYX-F-186]|uniref:SDR family NAD(P)-dependent oxidoreductase n=1 Tax=Phytohabitans maris TaxID=3071409 RepID=A0ABU0ZLU8_9ACTN|nr:SDR family NAD(P)-dependent oxidoreductase [Phytohabitans sp. ZYX-F-186]MDQ7908014.1 SDR family NAD(P)-dependent oxidoreductase [Phytohabitans sp. ZYX-F-186]